MPPSRPSSALQYNSRRLDLGNSGPFTPRPRTEERISEEHVEAACRALFDAYDLDESGKLAREEFLKIEMRLAFTKGEIIREEPLFARLTLANKDNSGQLSFDEFRSSQMKNFYEQMLTKTEMVSTLNDLTRNCIEERRRMGPRYHIGIRAELRKIFQLYDTSGDGKLSPEQWIAAQRIVAEELREDLDESWINEVAFKLADTNGDGVLSEDEYLEASFSMLEVTRMSMAQLMQMLQNITRALEEKLDKETTQALQIYMQASETPGFPPPSQACQDEPKAAAAGRSDKWKQVGEIKFPSNLTTADEVIALARLRCAISSDTWLSLYVLGPNPEGGNNFVTLLRDSNTKSLLDYLSTQESLSRLYIKNVRTRPKKLTRQSVAPLKDHEALLAKRTGNCWGIDWETQLAGAGSKYPRAGEVPIAVGDAVVIEIPATDAHGEFSYVPSIYMDGTRVVSKPVEETIEPRVKKKKKKGKVVNPEDEKPPDLLKQLSFIGLQPGRCVMFLDISWEDHEEDLCQKNQLGAPVKDNSTARIGPIAIEVTKPLFGAPKDKTFMWWNGDKWSNKKGPAKKKGKK